MEYDEMVHDATQQWMNRVAKHREQYLRAWIARTGIDPSEAVLVTQYLADGCMACYAARASDVLDGNHVQKLAERIAAAKRKHPGNKHMFGVLLSEVGELADGLINKTNWRDAALDVACVAMRIYESGDSDYDVS